MGLQLVTMVSDVVHLLSESVKAMLRCELGPGRMASLIVGLLLWSSFLNVQGSPLRGSVDPTDLYADGDGADSDFSGPNITEKQLITSLLKRYHRIGQIGRPVTNTMDNLTVYFGLSLIQILDVDETDQVLKSSIWYRYEWVDALLRWDPDVYSEIKSVRLPSSKIWKPDILLYNFADDRLREQRDALVVVDNMGKILWMPQAILRSSCSFDTKYFPFDVQTCQLKFGSWTYNGDKLDVQFVAEHSLDLSDYVISNEWEIVENSAKRNSEYYSCCPGPFVDLTFKLTLRRRTAFYTFILILPCALLSLLTLVIFWVPPESPAKLQLGMSVFVAFFFLLLVLADFTPRATASIPLIGAYFCLSMVMITLSTVLACIVTNMYFRGVRINRAPKWMRMCAANGVARIFGLAGPQPRNFHGKSKSRTPDGDLFFGNDQTTSADATDNLTAKVRLLERNVQAKADTEQSDRDLGHDGGPPKSSHAALIEEVRRIRDILTFATDKSRQEEEKGKTLREWRVLACIMDRVFFVFYVTVNAIIITILFTAT